MTKLLNEACLPLLRDHIGVGATSTERQAPRGRKVKPTSGKAVVIYDVADDKWTCEYCKKDLKKDDNRWIVCDKCDSAFHLQHSGVQYRKRDYDTLDIENTQFYCDTCQQVVNRQWLPKNEKIYIYTSVIPAICTYYM